MTEQFLTLAEAARRMGTSPKVVQTMVLNRKLPSISVGSRVRIPAGAVQVYVELADEAVALTRRLIASARGAQP